MQPFSSHLVLTRCARSLYLLTILSLFCAALAAQPGPRFVNLANQTPFDRHEWATATVPFARGEWVDDSVAAFHVPNHPHELVPYGARWPDGSVRYARLDVRVALPANSSMLVPVVPGPPTATLAPFHHGAMLADRVADLRFSVIVGGLGDGLRTLVLDQVASVVHDSDVRRTLLLRGRVPDTDFVCDFWLTAFSGQDTMHFEMRLTASRVGSQQWIQPVSCIALVVEGAIPHLRNAARHGVLLSPPSELGANVALLRMADTFYDAQGYEWRGELMPYSSATDIPDPLLRVTTFCAAAIEPLKGVATNWAESGAFGPFGQVPEFPSWITDGGVAAAQAKRNRFHSFLSQQGDPWEDRELGLVKDAGTTGDQYDFGAAKVVDVFRTALPARIEEIRFSAGEDAQRPTHHREADGSPVTHNGHPNWVAWSGRTHFNSSVSPDRLGKPFPEPFPESDHGWRGKDRQHWSSLTLASAYLLTCSDSLAYELACEAELFEAQHTLPSERPGWSTNGMGAARGVGRTYNSLAWNYLCTGNESLLTHMLARLDENIVPQMTGLMVNGPTKPVLVYGPDIRLLLVDHWRPWEDAQAALGLEALALVAESPLAHFVAYVSAKNVVNHGWRDIGTTQGAEIATAIAWVPGGGLPVTDSPLNVLWSAGTAFNEWSLSTVKIARRLAGQIGESAVEARADAILQDLAARRNVPNDFSWDRYAEWDAVR